MIKLENTEIVGWEHSIHGMRNPKNSWDKSDSFCTDNCDDCSDKLRCAYNMESVHGRPFRKKKDGTQYIGSDDHKLMMKLSNAGTDHRKYMRMITVYADITAPLYWWKEFDTYKVGTVANSCSTMHKIHDKEFTLDDFSIEHLIEPYSLYFEDDIITLNECRDKYIETKDKKYWWQMIQLLPSSYNQKRTVMLNYEVLANIYKSRKNHKLDEWRELCKWIERLPYSEIITGDLSDKKRKDLVDVCRCKNCEYYISSEDMKENDMYKDYENTLGYNGFCMNVDKWADEDDFCSYGKTKGSDD